MKQWVVSKLNKELAMEISQQYELPQFFSMLLAIRNITGQEAVESYLEHDELTTVPASIKDMDKAARRVTQAMETGEKICIFGDYDADGVTATALLYSYLRDMGADVSYYIPSRDEGYGMNIAAVDTLKEKGVQLIITVDNGIAACKEIEHANSLGIDTVVTDHHAPQSAVPNAAAVVDMHQADCNSTFKDMAGVGVAFMLVMAIEGEYADFEQLFENYADLLAIGTVGDLVPLLGDNRVFAKRGLRHIQQSDRCGVLALMEEAGLADKKINSGNLAFSIVPRINAVGRLGHSRKSVELLLTEDPDQARKIAEELGNNNKHRQEIGNEILQQVSQMIETDPSLIHDRVIVISGKDWHQGVIGIVAAKVKERFDKPVVIISVCDGAAKGSGRSVKGFSLCDAVAHCGDILDHYGGHPMAAGLSLREENIPLFRQKINAYAKAMGAMPFSQVNIDCKLNPSQLGVTIAQQIAYLEPFGEGNPAPLFGLYNMTVTNIFPIGNQKHLRITLGRDGSTVTALNFFVSPKEFPFKTGDVVDLAVTLSADVYKNKEVLTIIIKYIKFSNSSNEEALVTNSYYESLLNQELLTREQAQTLLPQRQEFALVYRYLRENNGFGFPVEILLSRIGNTINYGKLKVILHAMKELGLIAVTENMTTYSIAMLPVTQKVDIEQAAIIKQVKEVCGNV